MSICVAAERASEAVGLRAAAERPPSLLVVDDHLPGRAPIGIPPARTRRGLSPHFDCRSLAEALAATRCVRFDLVLMDPGLPDAVGMRGVRAMREALPDAWIAVVSALLGPDAARACRDAGADDVIATAALSGQAFDRLMTQALRHRDAVERSARPMGGAQARERGRRAPRAPRATPAAPSPAARPR